jgi:hypothetical protein
MMLILFRNKNITGGLLALPSVVILDFSDWDKDFSERFRGD